MSYQKHQTIEFLSKYKVKGSVLDIGGGENPVKGMVKWKAKKYLIADNNKKLKPDILWDINKVVAEIGFYEMGEINNFNWVFFLGTMSYVYNLKQALHNAYHMLKKGGTLITNSTFIYPYHDKKEYCHQTPHGFIRLLKEIGFRIKRKKYIKLSKEAFKYYKKMCKADGLFMHPDLNHRIAGVIIEAKKE